MNNNNNNNNKKVKVDGCGCRYRNKECEHLCDTHLKDFILKIYNKDLNAEKSMREWLEIAKAMETELTKSEEGEYDDDDKL